jgi:hypothetical protein
MMILWESYTPENFARWGILHARGFCMGILLDIELLVNKISTPPFAADPNGGVVFYITAVYLLIPVEILGVWSCSRTSNQLDQINLLSGFCWNLDASAPAKACDRRLLSVITCGNDGS